MTEPSKITAIGKTFKQIYFERKMLREKAINDLWERNGLKDYAKRDGYKVAETKQVNRDGTEIIEYRLYKMVDVAVTTLKTQVVTQVETGLDKAKEFYHHSEKQIQDFKDGDGV